MAGDVRALPFAAASFDGVVDFGTCYHVARADRALPEVERVLRPGGIFLHETRVSQLAAHPIRAFGRRLPWPAAPLLASSGDALLWAARRRASSASA